MERKILKINDFLSEQETTSATGSASPSTGSKPSINRPETERETRSRIATSLVKNLLGGNFDVSTEGGDSRIDVTKEVKESIPYRGCGASEPFKLERTPIGVGTFKILLSYLQEKGVGNYSRAIKELDEKRALIIGVRNKISVKKEAANQDRFIDSLYFIPGNAKDGLPKETLTSLTPSPKSGSKDAIASNTSKSDDPLVNLSKSKKKNEEYSFDDIYKKASVIQEERGNGILTYEEFYSIYENSINEDDKKGATGAATGAATSSVGDMISPYQITTVPSLAYYGNKPLNPKGTGIKMPGDTVYFLKESTLGHGTYKMLVEGEKIKVGRYPIGVTKYETYKPADVYEENCGMQIHRSSTKGVGICVGPWSGGCQVFADYTEFKDLISKCEKESMNASKFIYALINLDDVENILPAALQGQTISQLKDAQDKDTQDKSEKDLKDTQQKQTTEGKTEAITRLAKYIKGERDAFNANETEVIKRYNQIVKSNKDWKELEKIYKSKNGVSVWDDLDNYLSNSDFRELNFRNSDTLGV